MDENIGWKVGDRVEIGGRTMLRPGFSLVGLTGVIFETAHNAPAGCLTVAVDWPAHGYNEESGYPDGSLPLFVNVLEAYLSDPDAPKPKPKFESKSRLREELGQASAPEKSVTAKPAESKEAPVEPEKSDDEPEGGRPRLRLV